MVNQKHRFHMHLGVETSNAARGEVLPVTQHAKTRKQKRTQELPISHPSPVDNTPNRQSSIPAISSRRPRNCSRRSTTSPTQLTSSSLPVV